MNRHMRPQDDSARSEDPTRPLGQPKVIRVGQQLAPGARQIRAEAGAISERLTALIHELSSLLDGTLRHVSLMSGALTRTSIEPGQEQDLERRLKVIRAALEQMTVCVDHAAGRDKRAWLTPGTINEAVGSAIAIAEPLATEQSIEVIATIDEAAGRAPAMCVYTIVLNAVRNAIEAISEARTSRTLPPLTPLTPHTPLTTGSVEVRVNDAPAGGRAGLRITISDNGPGVSPALFRLGAGSPGATTKRGHLGVGLALVRELIEQHGGWMDLGNRIDKPGACLSVWLPREANRLAPWPDAPTDSPPDPRA